MTARRVTFVTEELLGYERTGGMGTATALLAVALSRLGHDVAVVYAGKTPIDEMAAEWQELYRRSGVAVQAPPAGDETFDSELFARMDAVERALAADPPDVVIAHDLRAPAYTAQRTRRLGLGFPRTLFVVFCHGTWRWTKQVDRNVRVFPVVFGQSVLDQAGVELADVVVSPSAYMLDWMRGEGWRLPETALVIPYVTRSGATGEPPPHAAEGGGRVERLVFFGRLEERKGVRPFAAGLDAVEPELLRGVELEFLGRATPAWPPERVAGLLSESVRATLRRISFETDLDQHEALARLSRPGTLAVMPSLGDNSPNTVYECLERGIPFIAGNVGGIPELVAAGDRTRVLFEPTADGVAGALRRALSDGGDSKRVQPAFDSTVTLERWAGVLAMRPDTPLQPRGWPPVDIVVRRPAAGAPGRCLEALRRQRYDRVAVTVADEPLRAVPPGSAPWVLLLEGDDEPDETLVATLVRAQAAAEADVVTCGSYRLTEDEPRVRHVFVAEPRALGLLFNGYGLAPLVRRSLLERLSPWPLATADPDWSLLATLAARGARIVSVHLPLVTRAVAPGSLASDPAGALHVVEAFERALPNELRSLARLAAGLAADAQRESPPTGFARRTGSLLRRTLGGRW